MSGDLQSGFYFEGSGGTHRHLHIDFGASKISLRNPNYKNEGPLVSVPGLSTPGKRFHFVVVATSPRYRVWVNGTMVIDYTDSFAATRPKGLGFDCAAAASTSSGSDAVSNLALYTVTNA
jgi:hypothetical protein